MISDLVTYGVGPRRLECGMLREMIVVDIETTGTDPQKHAMIDLAALDLKIRAISFIGQ